MNETNTMKGPDGTSRALVSVAGELLIRLRCLSAANVGLSMTPAVVTGIKSPGYTFVLKAKPQSED